MSKQKRSKQTDKPINDTMYMVVTMREVTTMYPSIHRNAVYRKVLKECTYRRDFSNGTYLVYLPSVLQVFGEPEKPLCKS